MLTADQINKIAELCDGIESNPWSVRWFTCTAEASDVAYERTRKLCRGQQRRDLKIGDLLWRVPLDIGPISVDTNRWSGPHIDASEELVEYLLRVQPVMARELCRLALIGLKVEEGRS